MTLETSADIAAYFDTSSGFAVSTLYIGNNVSKNIPVIIGDTYEDVSVGGGVQVEGHAIEVLVRRDDVSTIKHGETLTIDETVYKVINIRKDSERALTTLIISED